MSSIYIVDRRSKIELSNIEHLTEFGELPPFDSNESLNAFLSDAFEKDKRFCRKIADFFNPAIDFNVIRWYVLHYLSADLEEVPEKSDCRDYLFRFYELFYDMYEFGTAIAPNFEELFFFECYLIYLLDHDTFSEKHKKELEDLRNKIGMLATACAADCGDFVLWYRMEPIEKDVNENYCPFGKPTNVFNLLGE